MKTNEINIRDPYILNHEEKYYLYGTRSATTWGPADGFDCYVSEDLENWEGPIEIFHNHGDFWADRCYWAPECYYYKGSFYLVASFRSAIQNLGTQILISDSPTGPFQPHSDGPVTPKDWNCLDGTLYFSADGTPYMIFGHSFEDNPNGEMHAIELSQDLRMAVGEPKLLFEASTAPWSVPIPFAKKEFGMDGDVYFVDGPCMYRTESGKLLMLWSSWGAKGYAVGVAISDNGEIDGKWHHLETPLYSENGGHGMLFQTKAKDWMYALHYPNDLYKERPQFKRIKEVNDGLLLV
ncbi:glycoside hydrolase family 43 protein [Bacillus sp. USDA818B3_A]|uniref:glycoside hydrolase family 43 protein n=1 Tax=Bacillus sp. USDA818B3_A TaxID=2698834 RepID=UPI00136E3EBA|nr:glycoside hydrolase family 43 protein [Bacillus sp. USDA818B3_A]